jgi:hypothetical protein
MEYWKFRAIDRLREYPLKQAALANIPERIKVLESSSRSIHSATADSTPVQGGGSTREDRLLSNIVERQELAANLARTKHDCAIVERGMAVLDDDERHVLDAFYTHRTKGYVDRLRDELGLDDERSVYKRVDRALLHFTIAAYGVTES